jgi:hypothetical protein
MENRKDTASRFARIRTNLWAFAPIMFVVIFAVLFFGGRSRFFQDPGTFWHTKTGERILQTGEFLDYDPFSYTFGGKPWTPYEWLGEVGMALLHRLGGFDLQLVVTVSILAGTFTWLGNRIAKTGIHWAAVVCVTGLTIATASNHFHVRPHILTMLFLAISLVLLAGIEAKRTKLISLAWLIPLFIIWTNTHGGALGGYATLAIVLFGWLVKYGLSRLGMLNDQQGLPISPIQNRSDCIQVIILGLLIASTMIVTPYGIDVPKVWIRLMQMPELKSFVIEHLPINARDPKNIPFFALAAVYLFMLLGLKSLPRMTWVVPIVWFYLGCDRCRHCSLFGIVALVAIADLFPLTRWADWLAKNRPDYYVRNYFVRSNGLGISQLKTWSFALPLPLLTIAIALYLGHRGWAVFDTERWPMPLISKIRESAGLQKQLPIFNQYNDGGFVIWHLPEFRPMVDDRCEVYGGKWLKEFTEADQSDARQAGEYLARIQKEYGEFEHALTRIGSGFDDYFQSQPETWQTIDQTGFHKFYQRKNKSK